jgi:hypothetical protein
MGDQRGRKAMPFVADRIQVHGAELIANAFKES